MSKYKYLIVLPVPDLYSSEVVRLMNEVSQYTGIKPPHEKLSPHISLHRPIIGISLERIIQIVLSIVNKTKPMRVKISRNLEFFGKEFAVLMVSPSAGCADFWSELSRMLRLEEGYVHDKYDHDNTLHVTIANKLSSIFDTILPRIEHVQLQDLGCLGGEVPINRVAIYKKLVSGGEWEEVVTYNVR